MSHLPSSDSSLCEETLDALLEGFQVLDHELRYVYVNDAAARHGRQERSALLGRRMVDCYPGIEQTALYAELKRCLTQQVSGLAENEFRFPDGSVGHFELRIRPVPQGVCVMSLDVSSRKQAEMLLRQSEENAQRTGRMEALGQLAAGVAHDFNNFLGVILGYCELALLRPEGPTSADIEEIMGAAGRSAELTAQLLAYGRRQVLNNELHDPVALVQRTLGMLRRLLGAKIELAFRSAPPVGSIEIDAAKFEQVLMNLVLNARDAMPQGGRIVVALGEAVLDEDYEKSHPGTGLGPHVVLSVSDTGVGMDAATQARIFEPFFTTKGPGHGTGLGLASVYGIVKQSGGDIWLYSEVGHGTTFKIYLPRARSSDHRPRSASRPSLRPVGSPASSGKLVLVADDNPILRQLAEDALSQAGFRVLGASSGSEALELCAGHPVDVLVTDLVMPGVHGAELAHLALRARPAIKVLCTSGHASAAVDEQRSLPDEVLFLEKPYLPSALVAAVRGLIEAG